MARASPHAEEEVVPVRSRIEVSTAGRGLNSGHGASVSYARRFMMRAESYRFKVGTIECIAVSDGTFTYAADAFVANAPIERCEEELRNRGLPPHEVLSPYTCLFVNTGTNQLLVDTGAGFAPTNGKLLENLAALGIAA